MLMFPPSCKQIPSIILMAMSGMPNETHKPLVTLTLLMRTSSYIHSFIHSFILHSVNPYKVIYNLKDIELVLLLIL